jgi:hypothetical protein
LRGAALAANPASVFRKYRTGQRFGAHHLADVLVGNKTERIARFGHDRIKTFGVGTELDARAWLSVIRQLVAQGHLLPDPEGHGGLILGPNARTVLRGEAPVRFRTEPKRPARRKSAPAEKPSPAALDPTGEALWTALRAWRLDEARRQEVPLPRRDIDRSRPPPPDDPRRPFRNPRNRSQQPRPLRRGTARNHHGCRRADERSVIRQFFAGLPTGGMRCASPPYIVGQR